MGLPGGCGWLAKSGLAVAVVSVSVGAVVILSAVFFLFLAAAAADVFEEVRKLPEVALLLALSMRVLEGVGGESMWVRKQFGGGDLASFDAAGVISAQFVPPIEVVEVLSAESAGMGYYEGVVLLLIGAVSMSVLMF